MAGETTQAAGAFRQRLRYGVRRPENWLQLVRFVVVGISGFIANVGAYAVAVHVAALDFRVAAFVGLMAGVSNNFFWHRHWTFVAREGHVGFQAFRFTFVYIVTFVIGLGLLQLLVDAGSSEVVAQAMSQVLITPLNFLGHKLWSFDD